MILILIIGVPAGCSLHTSTTPDDSKSLENETMFYGMCDASGAVPLSSDLFAAADDEDNILRVFSASRGGSPLYDIDLSPALGLHRIPKKDPSKGFKKPAETDLEAATRLGPLELWITSHGLNASGKLKTERLYFFATRIPSVGENSVSPLVGRPYTTLLQDLMSDDRYRPFNLEAASQKAPKAKGGLNIEGMTAREEGGVFIGFRNPIPNGKALVAVLENPEEIVLGTKIRLGTPVLMDLGGNGVRGMSRWRGRYLILAGSFSGGGATQLYTWDGKSAPERISQVQFEGFNPEGFFTPEELDSIMVLSDDGEKSVNRVPCKKLKDHRQKSFRGMWINGQVLTHAAEE